MTDPATTVQTYFDAWVAKDFDTLATVLADDVTFKGALGTADGAQECLAGLRGMSQIMTDVDVHHRWVDGDDVITWFELHTTAADPIPTVNWMRMRDGQIARIRVTFDPRPLLAGDGG